MSTKKTPGWQRARQVEAVGRCQIVVLDLVQGVDHDDDRLRPAGSGLAEQLRQKAAVIARVGRQRGVTELEAQYQLRADVLQELLRRADVLGRDIEVVYVGAAGDQGRCDSGLADARLTAYDHVAGLELSAAQQLVDAVEDKGASDEAPRPLVHQRAELRRADE